MKIRKRRKGLYELFFKRILDIICSLSAILIFGWLYVGVALLVKINLGSPVLFTQLRPGKNEKIFKMYKFRTMSNEKGENGKLLSDEERLGKFGKMLRATSLDELPEVFNILKGEMSIVGPRPQLVSDMVFMTPKQRKRHSIKPGLSGLAQVNGRNEINWKEKLDFDLKYIKNISFTYDMKIIFLTIKKAIIKQEGITGKNMATALDYGDYLLYSGIVDTETYKKKQELARRIVWEARSRVKRKRILE